MKLGRISVDTPFGPVSRLVAAEPSKSRVVDLASAEVLRRQAKGATREAAQRLSSAIFPPSMSAAIALGEVFLETAHEAVTSRADDAATAISNVNWLSAVDPPVIRDGLTFVTHIKQFHERVGVEPTEALLEIPGYFKGTPFTAVGHDAEVPKPFYTDYFDYELELGYVVGRICHNLTPEEAQKALFGVTIFNDYSARDVQKLEMKIGMGPGKGKDFAFGIGPWIVTMDEIGRLDDLEMAVRINGKECSRGNSKETIWSPGESLAYMSISEYVQPGDLFASGTVGNGSGLEIGRKLEPGDVLELEVSRIGTLRSKITAPEEKRWWPEKRKKFW
ncbi:fumarylacetoacetate hydrolase family protein [Bradyrhizobium sp. STM 3561]|uniref:fumarylacetoacetate hydrolase family protein n=1 Tax=unclassified Bradyrhizobium TaxID=2631580 RepID=UPI003890A6E0